MQKVINLVAGLAGAITLNILHESLKHQSDDMPRVDLVGEEALDNVLGTVGMHLENDRQKYAATLAADVVSNALYFSMIGLGKDKHIWTKAITLGLTAGLGAVKLPEPMGLDATPTNKTTKTKGLTIGYYLAGALVTGLMLKVLRK